MADNLDRYRRNLQKYDLCSELGSPEKTIELSKKGNADILAIAARLRFKIMRRLENCVILENIYSFARKQYCSERLIRLLILYCKKNNIPLIKGEIDTCFGLTFEELESFYQKLGFAVEKNGSFSLDTQSHNLEPFPEEIKDLATLH